MSLDLKNSSSINKLIQNNYKLGNEGNIKNETLKENNNKDDDNSFHQLLNLQLLIQKYTGLKELCKLILIFFYFNSYKRKRRYY